MPRWFVSSLSALLLLAHPGCSDDDSSNGPVDQGDGGPAGDGGASTLGLDDLISGCIRTSACGIKTYPSLSNCLDAYLSLYRIQGQGALYDGIYRCVNAKSGSCDDIAQCHRRGSACDKSYQASCNGKVALSCDLIDYRIYELDCSVASLDCLVATGQTFTASCTPGACTSSYLDNCDGSRLLSCSSGIIEIRDCGKLGMTCGLGGWRTKTYSCQGASGVSCSSFGKNPFKSYCTGSTAVTCEHGMVHNDDCTKHTYVETACKDGACIAAGTQCTSALNRCNGAKLEACLDGYWKQFDCSSLGLGPCKQSATYGANCSDPAK